MRLDTPQKKSPGQASFSQKRRISPRRQQRMGVWLFFAGWLFVLLVGMVFIRVKQVRYGQEIEQHRSEVARLGSEVRDLRSRKAQLTAYTTIESTAKGMGMVFPPRANETLIVTVPSGSIPPTWREKLSPVELAVRQATGRNDLLAGRRSGTP